jgi:hypothetical protein
MPAVVNHQQRVLVSQQCDDGLGTGRSLVAFTPSTCASADHNAITQCANSTHHTQRSTVLLPTSGNLRARFPLPPGPTSQRVRAFAALGDGTVSSRGHKAILVASANYCR